MVWIDHKIILVSYFHSLIVLFCKLSSVVLLYGSL